MGNAGAYGAVAGERPREQIVYTSRFYIFTPELAKMTDIMGTISTWQYLIANYLLNTVEPTHNTLWLYDIRCCLVPPTSP